MAEQNINESLEPRTEPLQAEVHNSYQPEPEKSKAGIFTLIIGLLLLVRGGMKLNDDNGSEIWGIIMIFLGLASLYVYFKDRI